MLLLLPHDAIRFLIPRLKTSPEVNWRGNFQNPGKKILHRRWNTSILYPARQGGFLPVIENGITICHGIIIASNEKKKEKKTLRHPVVISSQTRTGNMSSTLQMLPYSGQHCKCCHTTEKNVARTPSLADKLWQSKIVCDTSHDHEPIDQ